MPVNQEYEVKLPLFEGPLDLLLYLITKAEIEITQISVSQITAQYLEYLDVMKDLNINIAADYLQMASTLIRLKARELLPPVDGESEPGDEDGIYNREQLIAQLLEYKKFREAAGTLKVFESEQFGAFTRGSAEEVEAAGDDEAIYLGSISMFDLLAAFKRILDRVKVEDPNHIVVVDDCKIDDMIERVLTMITERDEVPFEDLFSGDYRKIVVVVTFMAILELVKMQEIAFRQEQNFGNIFVTRRTTKEPALLQSTPEPAEEGSAAESGEVGSTQEAENNQDEAGPEQENAADMEHA